MGLYPDLLLDPIPSQCETALRDIDITDPLFDQFDADLYGDMPSTYLLFLETALENECQLVKVPSSPLKKLPVSSQPLCPQHYVVRDLNQHPLFRSDSCFFTFSVSFPLDCSRGRNDFRHSSKSVPLDFLCIEDPLELDALQTHPLSFRSSSLVAPQAAAISCAFPLNIDFFYSSLGFPCMDISFCYEQNLPIISGEYAGRRIVILLDTGSSNNLVPLRWWSSLPPEQRPFLHRAPVLQDCQTGGSPIRVIGHVNICI